MTDREGLFSKGRNPNSSHPVARPLTFKYSFCQAGERKKTLTVLPSGQRPFRAGGGLSFKALKCYAISNTEMGAVGEL
jgi:hypothetical protein